MTEKFHGNVYGERSLLDRDMMGRPHRHALIKQNVFDIRTLRIENRRVISSAIDSIRAAVYTATEPCKTPKQIIDRYLAEKKKFEERKSKEGLKCQII